MDQDENGFITREDFYIALKLIKLSQEGITLTPEIFSEVLSNQWDIQIPAPEMPLPSISVSSPSFSKAFTV
jgi:hypothetical protein